MESRLWVKEEGRVVDCLGASLPYRVDGMEHVAAPGAELGTIVRC